MYYIDRRTGQAQKKQQQPSVSPLQIMDYFKQGGEGGAGGVGGGSASNSGWSFGAESSGGPAGWIAAAIILQEILSNNTGTEFEGQRTGDVFDLDFMTEPWLGFAFERLGFEPTAGEKFDAAVKNSDWGLAGKRLPAAANYWAHPEGQLGYEFINNLLGEDVSKIILPVEWLMNNLSDIF